MIKKIAIIVLIVTVLAGFSISAIRIIMHGSVRSEKTENEIKMSEIIENATIMGTYSSDISIKVGEKIGAKVLLESSLSNPVSVGSDLPYVNLSKCSIYFDNGKTIDQILSPGKKKFTIIVSNEAANRDYVYYVEFVADEAPVTTVTSSVSVTSSSTHNTTIPEKKYDTKPQKTEAVTKVTVKKPVAAVTSISHTEQAPPETIVTDQNPVTEPPQTDTPPEPPVTPSVPDTPPDPPVEPSDPQPPVGPSDPQLEAPEYAQ